MKRLFSIKDTKTGKINAQDFPNKMEAKARRDKLNGGGWDEDGAMHRYVVVLGPDHRRFNTEEGKAHGK